ncbi:TIGR03617 family F420-dependent LLM class oxidoreductase [Herbiconiux moechotypicola]|uniref:LLM class F420-dependent oxidoreductase n=1 Tax=Herbiconiux moechotypicola TaxID=637393 RepID=A0ABN3DCW1_9MICO|nr:TIGR03617 family F420-dependent LLM class oxidoreductase [Herbiconiux moechotypicola]MCS5728746.1 TIGR03617 family F420-dependent LLM class oxidoreductase [Herbiconiux moechotypicola]
MPDDAQPAEPTPSVPFAIDAGGDVSAGPLELELAATQAEAAGFDGVLGVELGHDPFVALALAARATSRVRLTTSIAVAFARSPMSTAVLANDLQLVSSGRFVLGLGSQVKPHIERRFSMPWSRPAARMREYVRALRAIQEAWDTGTRLNFAGEFYTHTLMPPMFSPGPNPFGPPPVTIAAVGPGMAEVAGEVADGMLAHPFTTERYLREVSLPAIARGRAAAGDCAVAHRTFEVSLPAFIAIGDTPDAVRKAQRAVKRQIAFYGSTPTYLPVLELHGWESVHSALHAGSLRGEWEAMADLVTDEMLDAFAISGTPPEVAAGLHARFDGLVQRLSFSAPYRVAPELWGELLRELRG